MSTIPDESHRDLRVRVTIGETASDMTVSGALLRSTAESIDVPPPFLCEDDYERRMIRRALMPIVKLAAADAAHRAAWTEVSRMLGLDPEKGR